MLNQSSVEKIYALELARLVSVIKEDDSKGGWPMLGMLVKDYMALRTETLALVRKGETPSGKHIKAEMIASLAVIGLTHGMDMARQEIASAARCN